MDSISGFVFRHLSLCFFLGTVKLLAGITFLQYKRSTIVAKTRAIVSFHLYFSFVSV